MTSDFGYVYSSQYVRNCHTACAHYGCQYQESIKTLAAAQEVLNNAERTSVMAGEWCEKTGPETPDGHPFNGKRGKAIIKRAIFDGSGHVTVEDTVTYCVPHADEAGLVPKNEEPAAIANGYDEEPPF